MLVASVLTEVTFHSLFVVVAAPPPLNRTRNKSIKAIKAMSSSMPFLLARAARGVNGESSHKGILPALSITKKFIFCEIIHKRFDFIE